MIKAAIVGGGGFAAGELIRIVIHHPEVNLAYVMSESQASKKVYETHQDLIGETGIIFTDKFDANVDVVFLCKGHGQSVTFLQENPIPDDVCVIDLSRDFRLDDGNGFTYGLPELNREEIKTCLLYTSPSPRDATLSRMPSSA